jgi:multiple sugar transport system permease protein
MPTILRHTRARALAVSPTYMPSGSFLALPSWRTVGRHTFLIALCLWVLLPLAWVVLLSLKSLPDGTQRRVWPHAFVHPIYDNYRFVFGDARTMDPYIAGLKNSVLVSLLTVAAATITAVLAGYALVHLRTPGSRLITAFLVASLFFPTQVTAVIGIFKVQDDLGLINETWSLMLPYTALSVAVSIFIMRGVFQSVPGEIVDSARLDGASSLRLLGGILLPMVRNGVVVVMIVSFTAAWGEFLLALTLMNDQDRRTLAVYLGQASGGLGAQFWPRTAAMVMVAILPTLVTFAFLQRWFMKGLQEGALKG